MSLYDKIIAVYNKIRGRIDGHFPVQTADIADGAVVNAKIGNEAVSGAKIRDKTITRGKIADSAVDSTPTAGSNNLVTSGGVKSALDGMRDKLDLAVYDFLPETWEVSNTLYSGGTYLWDATSNQWLGANGTRAVRAKAGAVNVYQFVIDPGASGETTVCEWEGTAKQDVPFEYRGESYVVTVEGHGNAGLKPTGDTIAKKSETLLTPIYPDTPTFSEWTFSDGGTHVVSPVVDGADGWYFRLDDNSPSEPPFDTKEEAETSLVLNFPYDGITATRTRTDILGYQLGSQTDKPLASEAEAEALRTAIADKATKADATLTPVYDGNGKKFSDWVCVPATYEGNPITIVETPSEETGMVNYTPYCNGAAIGRTGTASEDILSLRWRKGAASRIDISATRTANKFLGYQLGEQHDKMLASAEQGAKADTAIQGVKVNGTEITPDAQKKVNLEVATKSDATLTPIYSDTPTFTEWAISPSGKFTDVLWSDYFGEFGWLLTFSGSSAYAIDTYNNDHNATSVSAEDGDGTIYTATRTRTDIIGYTLGSQTDKPLASEAEAEALRTGKADKPSTFTTGNLAKFDAQGNPTDSGKKPSDFQTALSSEQIANIAAVPNKASKADATLAERGFSAWTIVVSPPPGMEFEAVGQPYYENSGWHIEVRYRATGEEEWVYDTYDQSGGDDGEDSLHVVCGTLFDCTRTVLSGYVLGSQTDKPLASEAEAEALRAEVAGKLNSASTGLSEFDSTTSYRAGVFVAYEGRVYKCTVAHTGVWNAAHFAEVEMLFNHTQHGSDNAPLAIGASSSAGSNATAVGARTTAGNLGVAVGANDGNSATSAGVKGVAVGCGTTAGDRGISIGDKARATEVGAIAIGGTRSSADSSGAQATEPGACQIGYSASPNNTPNSLRFRDTTVVNGNGKIPSASLDVVVAEKSDIPYALVEKTPDAEDAVALDDRACNYVDVRSRSNLVIEFPEQVDGKSRTFVLVLDCGATPPTVSYADFITIMAEDASSLTPETGVNFYRFTEMRPNRFEAERKLVVNAVDNSPSSGDQLLDAMERKGIDTSGITNYDEAAAALGLGGDDLTLEDLVNAVMQ